jgi:serine/threonine-protein kinase
MGDTVSSYPGHRPLPAPGAEIGNYRIVDLLGSGGMGQVFLAEHKKLGRKVALKLLLPEFASNAEVVSRFFHEAKAVNQINHEHIVEIVDFVEEPGGYNYFIMELLEGRDLAKAREDDGPFSLVRIIHIIGQICTALAASHAKGIVHRDLKPENIFLITRGDDKDFVKLLDFGIAKLSGMELGDKPQTRAGMILGTPEYMSPEQAGGRPIDYRSDLYSLGVVTYWMLSDQLPYRGKSFGELMVKQLTTAPMPIPETNPAGEAIPPMLSGLIFHCLEREPAKRVQSAGEMLETLTKLGVVGALYEAPILLKPKRPRSPWMLPSIAAAAVLVLGIALGIWHFSGSDEDKGSGTEQPTGETANAAPPLNPTPTVAPSGPATAPTPTAALPPPVPAPTGAVPPPEKPIEASAKPVHTKPAAQAGHKHKKTPTPAPDDNTGMIDPFAN